VATPLQWFCITSAATSWFVCSATQWSETEEKKCQLQEVSNATKLDASVCGPATYVVEQTPSLTEVAGCIVMYYVNLDEQSLLRFSLLNFVTDYKLKEVCKCSLINYGVKNSCAI